MPPMGQSLRPTGTPWAPRGPHIPHGDPTGTLNASPAMRAPHIAQETPIDATGDSHPHSGPPHMAPTERVPLHSLAGRPIGQRRAGDGIPPPCIPPTSWPASGSPHGIVGNSPSPLGPQLGWSHRGVGAIVGLRPPRCCDVRRGRALAQVDKAGEKQECPVRREGGRKQRALQVGAGLGWGSLCCGTTRCCSHPPHPGPFPPVFLPAPLLPPLPPTPHSHRNPSSVAPAPTRPSPAACGTPAL